MKKFIFAFMTCIALVSMSFVETAKASDRPPTGVETLLSYELPACDVVSYEMQPASCVTCHASADNAIPTDAPCTKNESIRDSAMPVSSLLYMRQHTRTKPDYTEIVYRTMYSNDLKLERGWNKRISC